MTKQEYNKTMIPEKLLKQVMQLNHFKNKTKISFMLVIISTAIIVLNLGVSYLDNNTVLSVSSFLISFLY